MTKQTLLFIATLMLIFSGCKKDTSSNTTPSQSAVMYVNAVSTGSAIFRLDGRNDNNILQGAANLLPLTCSEYINVPSGSHVSFTLPGSSASINSPAEIGTNLHYSYFAFGAPDSLLTVLAADDLIVPDPGKAKVRFANFCYGSSGINCYFNGQIVGGTVKFGDVAPFVEVSPAGAALNVVDPLRTSFTAGIPNQTFLTGKIYTVIFTDTSSDAAGMKLTVITDR